MTRDQFISGVPFKVQGPTYKGANTFYYNLPGYMSRQTRSSIDERIILDEYCLNVCKVGKVGFEGFVYVMNKKVAIKYRFSDLVQYSEQSSQVEVLAV